MILPDSSSFFSHLLLHLYGSFSLLSTCFLKRIICLGSSSIFPKDSGRTLTYTGLVSLRLFLITLCHFLGPLLFLNFASAFILLLFTFATCSFSLTFQEFISYTEKELGITEPEGWYNHSAEDLKNKFKGSVVLQRYHGSLLSLLRVCASWFSSFFFASNFLSLLAFLLYFVWLLSFLLVHT